MKDALNEQLSACLDGELPPAELDLLLKRVGKEAELRAAIGRYSLIGEAMRAERPAVASRDFAGKVMAAVAQEAPMQAPAVTATAKRVAEQPAATHKVSPAPVARPALVRFGRPAVGMAIAASVAAVAVLMMQPVTQPELGGEAPLVAANEPTVDATGADAGASYVVPTSTSNPAFIPPAARLTNYVVAHSEYSSPLGRRSVWSGVVADDDYPEVDGAAEDQDAPVQITTSDDGAPVR
ncbi:MAG TPA: sigma-E factor negative regulatory protein [Candidatus Synoicihabitans sp.]|nr:sigma-E factor negative regulatory protein [Candidatus Synoicihabitans sp.]